MTEVVAWPDIEQSVRRAIEVHIAKAHHKGKDVEQGCDTCLLLLALNFNMRRKVQTMSSQGDG
jgi:hypothetical protein